MDARQPRKDVFHMPATNVCSYVKVSNKPVSILRYLLIRERREVALNRMQAADELGSFLSQLSQMRMKNIGDIRLNFGVLKALITLDQQEKGISSRIPAERGTSWPIR